MPVPIKSYGYPAVFDPDTQEVIEGAIDSRIGAKYWPAIQSGRYTALGPDHWKVTSQVGIDRGIRIGAGSISGDAILDTLEPHDTFSLPLVATGSRWYLVVARRSWTDPAVTTIEFIEGALGTARPTSLPAYRKDPGASSDHPLAYCRVDAGDGVIRNIIDLRIIGGAVAYDKLALKVAPAHSEPIQIGDWEYRFKPVGNGAWDWVPHHVADSGWIPIPNPVQGFFPVKTSGWSGAHYRVAYGWVFLNAAVRRGINELGQTVGTTSWPNDTACIALTADLGPAIKIQGVGCQVAPAGAVANISLPAGSGAVSISAMWALKPPA